MAQGVANGQWFRDGDDDGLVTEKKTAHPISKISMKGKSFIDAGEVTSTFGYRLDERMNAYSSAMNEFGHPGNTVDHWRLQFNGQGGSFKAANNGGGRRRY